MTGERLCQYAATTPAAWLTRAPGSTPPLRPGRLTARGSAPERCPERSGHVPGSPHDVVPGEVHHLEPGRPQPGVAPQLCHRAPRVAVLDRSIGLANGPEPLPQEVGPADDPLIFSADPSLQHGRRDSLLAEDPP